MYAIGEYHDTEFVRLWTQSTTETTTYDNFGAAQFIADRLNTSGSDFTTSYKVLELVERSVRA